MSLEDVNRAFADLKSAVTPADPKVQLKIANSLWARSGFTLNPEFVERNKQHYAAEIASLAIRDNQTGVVLFMGSVTNPG